jgi:hypothetical protein
MKTKCLFFTFLLILSLSANSQDIKKKIRYNYSINSGYLFLGSGDQSTINIENEFNFEFLKVLSSSFGANLGSGNYGLYHNSSYVQGNFNIFVSPFGNIKKNRFKIGYGISLMKVTDTGIKPWDTYQTGKEYDQRASFGYNLILQHDYFINSKYFIGLKGFTQIYNNKDYSTGVNLRLGLVL